MSQRRKEVVPTGTVVIYYNLWTGFETRDFSGEFLPLTKAEIAQLKPGDTLYVDVDPLHPRGKVYGRVKARLVKLERVPGDSEYKIHFAGGHYEGFRTTENGLCHSIDRARNEDRLALLIKKHPLSSVISMSLS